MHAVHMLLELFVCLVCGSAIGWLDHHYVDSPREAFFLAVASTSVMFVLVRLQGYVRLYNKSRTSDNVWALVKNVIWEPHIANQPYPNPDRHRVFPLNNALLEGCSTYFVTETRPPSTLLHDDRHREEQVRKLPVCVDARRILLLKADDLQQEIQSPGAQAASLQSKFKGFLEFHLLAGPYRKLKGWRWYFFRRCVRPRTFPGIALRIIAYTGPNLEGSELAAHARTDYRFEFIDFAVYHKGKAVAVFSQKDDSRMHFREIPREHEHQDHEPGWFLTLWSRGDVVPNCNDDKCPNKVTCKLGLYRPAAGDRVLAFVSPVIASEQVAAKFVSDVVKCRRYRNI